jgi:hypothetical protein
MLTSTSLAATPLAPEDCVLAVKTHDGEFIFYLENNKSELRGSFATMDDGVVKLAMRRIIKEPKRWTWEDKKAGVLPEVGCEVLNTDMSISRYVLCEVIHVNADVVIVYNGELSQTYSHAAFVCAFNPIETPAEKAQREEDEFVELTCRQNEPHSTLYGDGVRAAYRKLKGGE